MDSLHFYWLFFFVFYFLALCITHANLWNIFISINVTLNYKFIILLHTNCKNIRLTFYRYEAVCWNFIGYLFWNYIYILQLRHSRCRSASWYFSCHFRVCSWSDSANTLCPLHFNKWNESLYGVGFFLKPSNDNEGNFFFVNSVTAVEICTTP